MANAQTGVPASADVNVQTQLAYHPVGNLLSVTDPRAYVTQFSYTALNQLASVTDPLSRTRQYAYDPRGLLERWTKADGTPIDYSYNALGLPTELSAPDQTVEYSYDDNGRPTVVTFPNGVTTTMQYDAAGQVLTMTHALVGGPPSAFAYRYDPTGRRSHALEGTRTISYTYDGLYRLAEARESSGDLYQYAYDAAGNRLSKIEPGEVITATYDAANQILALNGLPATYDTNGNLLGDGQRSFAYDDLDRLIQVTQGLTSTTFGYTGDGDRLWQASDGVTTTFTLDLNTALTQVLAQQGGGHTTYFLPGGGQQVDGIWQYLHADALGSVRLLSDASGQALGTMRYSPFGEIEEQSGASSLFGFTGEPQDPASGLTYLRARYYDPALGRFLTPDAIVPDPTNGQAWNAYAYVYNDPVNLVDPSGFAPDPAGGGWLNRATTALGDLVGGAGEAASDTWQWWNKRPCNCLSPNEASLLGKLSNWLTGTSLAPLIWAFKSGPVKTEVTETTQLRQIKWKMEKHNGGYNISRGPWYDSTTGTVRGPSAGTWKGEPQTVRQTTSDGRMFQPRTDSVTDNGTTRTETRVSHQAKWGGATGALGSVVIGSVLSGLGQFASDLLDAPCLSPRERALHFFQEAFWAVPGNIAGTVVAGTLARRGVSKFTAAVGGFAGGWLANQGVQAIRP